MNLIRLFVAVVQSRNLSAAARRCGMTRSNASRQIKALETEVGAQLLRRTTRHTEVTEAGRILYEHGLRMLEEAEAARASIDSLGQSIRGNVRIRLPTGLGHFYLASVLREFSRVHPDVTMQVHINDHIGDLISAEVDVALKITSTPPEDHVARRLCDVAWCLCASPAFIRGTAPIRDVDDLTRCAFITPIAMGRTFKLKLDMQGTAVVVRLTPRLQSGDYPYLVEAVSAGLGIALLPRYAVWRQLEDGALVEILPRYAPEGPGDGLFLLTAPNRYPTLATRALIDYIKQQILEQQGAWQTLSCS